MKHGLAWMAALAAAGSLAAAESGPGGVGEPPATSRAGRPRPDIAAAEWLPLASEPDVLPGSALDFSGIAAAHAPCGVHGRVVARGDHFEFEGIPGEPARFWGVNLSHGANLPDVEKAEEIAARFAALGYNAVRIHHHDGDIVAKGGPPGGRPLPDADAAGSAGGPPGGRPLPDADAAGSAGGPPADAACRGAGGSPAECAIALDPDAMRRLDALVAACARHGLYVSTDVFVSRAVPWRDVGIDRDGAMDKSVFKHLVTVHEGAFSNWCAFAMAFLGHVNEFTGVRYADDPTIAWVALVNEGNLDNGAGPAMFETVPEWREKWTAWLAARAAPAETSVERRKTGDGENPAVRNSPFFTAEEAERFAGIPQGNHWNRTRHVAAFSRFLAETEMDFERRAVRFLREEVGLQALVSNMSAWMNPPEYQIPIAGPFQDYVESHSYQDHPSFPGKQWGLPCRVGAENPVRSRGHTNAAGAMNATLKRVFGKPMSVTEFNYCGPNPFRGAGGLLFGAEAAAQDWGAAFRFDWASSKKGVEEPGTAYCGLFAVNCDPLRQASERAAAALFLRGDLAPCEDDYAILLPPSKIVGIFDGESHQLNTPWPELAWRARLGSVVAEKAPAGTRWVDPYPDYYKRGKPVADLPPRADISVDPAAGWFKVATPRTCGVVAEGGAHEAGALRVEIVEPLHRCTVEPLADAGDTNGSTVQRSNGSTVRRSNGSTIWVSALDGEALEASSRILVGFLTDLRNTGMVADDEPAADGKGPATLVHAWGGLPYVVRRGVAKVELAVGQSAPDGNGWRCWALSQGGRRVAQVPVETLPDGRVALTLDNAEALAQGGAFFWELERF